MAARGLVLNFLFVAAFEHARGRSIEIAPDLMAKLLEQIRARPDCEATCRRKIGQQIAMTKSAKEVGDVDPSTAVKAELEKFHYALKKVSGTAAQLSLVTRRLLFNDLEHEFFSDERERLTEEVDTTLSLI